jgi:hypothetical protein
MPGARRREARSRFPQRFEPLTERAVLSAECEVRPEERDSLEAVLANLVVLRIVRPLERVGLVGRYPSRR